MRAYCEYLENPVGIDVKRPRFSWIVDEDATSQCSYRIIVKHSLSNRLCWDSGVVESDETANIEYAGEKLETAARYEYSVDVLCSSGKTFHIEDHTFTMGILDDPVWPARWIGGPGMEIQAFWFRTSVEIKKTIRAAYFYVVSPNYYVLYVNGKKADDSVLQNANTDSRKTMLYATYPITELLKSGENVIGVELGNGWRALDLGRNGVGWGEHLFSTRMYLEYACGDSEWIDCDPDKWKYAKKGPVIANSIYQGEFYDATKELTGWNEPGFDETASDAEWFEAVEFEPEEGEVRAQYLEPIRVVRLIKPTKIHRIADGSYTFDMGQNFAGWARLKITGKAGTKITLVYSELEFEDHIVNQISLRNMRCTDTYILKGEKNEIYEPRFTFHGFRYVQVFGLTEKPDDDTLTGCVVRSDVRRIGSFSCDNPMINKLQSNICWTEESNLHSIPTDCPQRDERLGWINDMTVRNECALYSFRLPALYTKWLRDIRDTQGPRSGAIADTAPFRVFGCRPADPVGASLLLIPWNLYRHYCDVRILEENYGAIRKYLDYLRRNSTGYIIRWGHMGDWAAPIGDNDVSSIGGGAVSMVTPTRLVATAFFYYNCILAEKIASVLGKNDDAVYYAELALKIREAFIARYYNSEKKYVHSNSQGCNTIALYFGLIPEEDRKEVLENLVYDIQVTNENHLTTGNMCSRYMIEVLLTNGYEDVAYDLLTQTTYPSWGFEIEKGATTIWERWEQVVSEGVLSMMSSYNHPMYGAVGVCFYKYLAGIDTTECGPGFKEITIHPYIPMKMKHAEACVDTIRGIVKNSWYRNGDRFEMETEIPFNSRAKLYIPKMNADEKCCTVSINGKVIWRNCEANGNNIEQTDEYIICTVNAGTYYVISTVE